MAVIFHPTNKDLATNGVALAKAGAAPNTLYTRQNRLSGGFVRFL